MTYFLIAGEASGDLHASNLMQALLQQDPQAHFVGLGGDKMRQCGCTLLQDYRQMAFMGFVAVFQNLHKVRANFRIAQQGLLNHQPDVLILIDYPSFNLRMAAFCKKHLPQTKIVYYIPPKVWAWKKRRVHAIARYCDRILGIFPFEEDFYRQYGYHCTYVGNPTMDSIRDYVQEHQKVDHHESTIVLLPGSRKNEIAHCLPVMLAAARQVQQHTHHPIVVTAAPGVEDDFYAPYLQHETLTRNTYVALQQASAAVVNSGTATLETALLGCPQTAVYYVAGGKLTNPLRHLCFSIPHFTLVNILARHEVIKELLAGDFTQQKVAAELQRLLDDAAYREHMLHEYEHIRQLLGQQPAATTAAQMIYALVSSKG